MRFDSRGMQLLARSEKFRICPVSAEKETYIPSPLLKAEEKLQNVFADAAQEHFAHKDNLPVAQPLHVVCGQHLRFGRLPSKRSGKAEAFLRQSLPVTSSV